MDRTSPSPARRRRALCGALALALVVPVLVGCGSDKKDKASDAGSTTSSTTGPPTAVLNADGSALVGGDGAVVTVPAGVTVVRGADGNPVLDDDGTVVTLPPAASDPSDPSGTDPVASGEGQYPCTLLTTQELEAAFGFAFTAPQAPMNNEDVDSCTWIPAVANTAVSHVSVSVLQQKHLKDGDTLPQQFDHLLDAYKDHSTAPLSVGDRSDRVSVPPTDDNGILRGLAFGRVLDGSHVMLVGTVANGTGDAKADVPDSAKDAISALTPKAYARL